MLELRTANVNLVRAPSDVEQLVPGGPSLAGSHFNFQGTASFTFDRPVRIAHSALQGFRFETKDDHHIKKIKIETNQRRVNPRTIAVGVEAHFGDASPEDDRYQFMTVQVLLIADTE
jgi:hypothetical protein